MSAPSTTASQTDLCGDRSRVTVTPELYSGYDTPVPRYRISDETIDTLNSVSPRLEGVSSRPGNPRKRC